MVELPSPCDSVGTCRVDSDERSVKLVGIDDCSVLTAIPESSDCCVICPSCEIELVDTTLRGANLSLALDGFPFPSSLVS
jgi:hypothetical protein